MAGSGFDLQRSGRVALAFAGAFAVVLVAASVAFAQVGRMQQGLSGRDVARSNAPPMVGCYESDLGEGFIFDRSSASPLLRLEGNPEIWVLRPVPGPRGDIMYKTDSGRTVLRSTSAGGITLFTPGRPDGAAVSFARACAPLRVLPLISPAVLFQRLLAASTRARRAAQHVIEMDADNATPDSAALTADAGMVTAEALVRMAGTPNGRRVLARVARISIVEGPRPQVALVNGVITVTITPPMSMSGRLSSDRIIAVLVR